MDRSAQDRKKIKIKSEIGIHDVHVLVTPNCVLHTPGSQNDKTVTARYFPCFHAAHDRERREKKLKIKNKKLPRLV